MAHDDPIVFPGVPGASHPHDFFGVKGIDAFTTTHSLHNAPNTCNFGADSFGVWIPSLVWADGSEHAATRIEIYYRKPVGSTDPVYPFPMGLRTIVGDAMNTTKRSAAVWACGRGPFQGTIPPASCAAEVVESIYFPQCWNRPNVDGPHHRTLVACTGGPGQVRLPQIQLIAHFPPGSGGGMLASDTHARTTGGRSAHADYWFAGDKRVWRRIVGRCLNRGIECRVVGRKEAWPPGSIVNVSVTPHKLVMTAAEATPRAAQKHRPRPADASRTSGGHTAHH